jgi:hypothetical protein
MASEAGTLDVDAVVISRELHGRLNEFVSLLHKRLLDAAVRHAAARRAPRSDVYLAADDILNAARVVLPAFVTELERSLSDRSSHVRRNAS